MASFYGWSSTASRLEPLQGGNLLFTTKFPEIPGTNILKTYMKSVNSLNKTQRYKRQKTCFSQVRPVNSNFVEKINTSKRKMLDGPHSNCIVCNR